MDGPLSYSDRKEFHRFSGEDLYTTLFREFWIRSNNVSNRKKSFTEAAQGFSKELIGYRGLFEKGVGLNRSTK